MSKFLFQISFKGTNYHGWQRQATFTSVQQSIEEVFERVFEQKINIHGCGRTDAGVHARQYFFHCVLPAKKINQLIFILNKNLPGDIRIIDFQQVNDQFNAQLDVISRTYHYHLHYKADPFLSDLSTYIEEKPDIEKIKSLMPALEGKHDFRAFSLTPDRQGDTSCEMFRAKIESFQTEDRFFFSFEAKRFIRAMVRLLVGNLLEVGYGRMSPAAFLEHLKTGKQPEFSRVAYPQGLYLAKVKYGQI